MDEKLLRTMSMGEIVKLYPETIDVMLSYGLHCIGCGASYWETLEQGTVGHGMSEEDVNALLRDMQAAIQTRSPVSSVIDVSDKAAEKLKDLLRAENKADHGLRIKVVEGGCSGYSYDMDFEKEKKDSDEVFSIKDVTFYVDKDSLNMVKGSKLEYLDGLKGTGFTLRNPNSHGSCACGQSFS